MLTDTDPRVLAHINLFAVLGALTELPRHSADARHILAHVKTPTTVRFRVRGMPERSLHFGSDTIGEGRAVGSRTVTLLLRSPAHLNAMIDGTAQPLPIAGPAGLTFLTRVFAPLADLLGRLLRPSEDDLADPELAEASALLSLHVAVAAVAQVANLDRSGRFSASLIPDGQVAVEVGDTIDLRLDARAHTLTFDPGPPDAPPRAALTFRDLDVAGDVLAGRASALACLGDGSMAMRGYIPMIDNVSRILDRVGHYLGDPS